MDSPETRATAVDWALGAGVVAVAVGVFYAAVSGRGGGLNASRFLPTWMTSWVRYTPETYAELVSRIAEPNLYLRMSAAGEDWPAYVQRSPQWCATPTCAAGDVRFRTLQVYEAMEGAHENVTAFMWMPSRANGAHEQTAYEYVFQIIKSGKPREILTDEERGILREFMEAASSYNRIHKAAVEESESTTDIGWQYTGALVSTADLARVLVKDPSDVRFKLEQAVGKQVRETADWVQKSMPTGRYAGHTTAELEVRKANAVHAMQLLRLRGQVPFAYFVLHVGVLAGA